MNKVIRSVMLLGGLLGLASGAMAQTFNCEPSQDPNICVTVTGDSSVTYSVLPGTPSFVTYTFSIKNDHSNVLNRVRFSAQVRNDSGLVPFTDPATGVEVGPGVYLEADGPTANSTTVSCTVAAPVAPAINNTINCAADTGLPADGSISFRIMVRAPEIGSKVELDWRASFAEGGSTSPSANNAVVEKWVTTSLAAPSNTVTTSLPAGGGTVATADDNIRMSMKVDPYGKQTRGTVSETEVLASENAACRNARNFHKCLIAEISAKDVDQQAVIYDPAVSPNSFLTFTLYVKSANIRNGTKPERVQVYYSSPAEGGAAAVDRDELGPLQMCTRTDANGKLLPNLPVAGKYIPCISERFVFDRRTAGSEWTADNDGDIRIKVLNLKNGRFEVL